MKPNVVIIMADQLRADVLGKGFTPHIDALRGESMVANHMYCASPLCVPARGAFFTGKYPNTNGSLINPWEKQDAHYGDVKRGIDNLYTLMETEWESIHIGKQHLFTEGGKLEDRLSSPTLFASSEKSYRQYLKDNGKPFPGGPGYKTAVPEMVSGKSSRISHYSIPKTGVYEPGEQYFFDSYFTQTGIDALRGRKGDRPLLLNAMFVAPHPPYQIPEKYYQTFTQDDFVLPENVGVWYPRQSPLQMYNLTGIIGTRYDREQWREIWRVYLGLVKALDDSVGAIITELKAEGIYDESLIVFTSDHGEMLGSHGLFQKMCMYEESVRIPFSLKAPKSEGKTYTEINRPLSQIDILPTLLEYLGITNPTAMDGCSFLPQKNQKRDASRPIFIQYDGNGSRSNFQRCVIKDGMKCIVDLFKDEIYYELYDLEKDPGETENLLFDESSDTHLSSLLAALHSHMKQTGDMLCQDFPTPGLIRTRYKEIPGK